MGDLVVVAPVLPTRETALRRHLRSLAASPLAQLPHETHFARFVVVPLDGPRLLFSSRFDVSVESYIEALARLPAAGTIWSHCESGEDLRDPANLGHYLTVNRVKSPYILAPWPKVSVSEVNEALERQARLSTLVVGAASLGPIGLAHAFRERFPR
jgi:hypothetical protein